MPAAAVTEGYPPLERLAVAYRTGAAKQHEIDGSTRPAVHWFTFADLCRAGRECGLARIYSLLDVLDQTDGSVARCRFRRTILAACRYNPIVRSLALTRLGGDAFMYRRAHDEVTSARSASPVRA